MFVLAQADLELDPPPVFPVTLAMGKMVWNTVQEGPSGSAKAPEHSVCTALLLPT